MKNSVFHYCFNYLFTQCSITAFPVILLLSIHHIQFLSWSLWSPYRMLVDNIERMRRTANNRNNIKFNLITTSGVRIHRMDTMLHNYNFYSLLKWMAQQDALSQPMTQKSKERDTKWLDRGREKMSKKERKKTTESFAFPSFSHDPHLKCSQQLNSLHIFSNQMELSAKVDIHTHTHIF